MLNGLSFIETWPTTGVATGAGPATTMQSPTVEGEQKQTNNKLIGAQWVIIY